MSHKKHKFTFKFDSEDKSIDREVIGFKSKLDAYENVRENLCSELNLSVREFESKFVQEDSKHKILFKSKPWDSGDQLMSDINSLDGIKSARYVLPTVNKYEPPKIVIDREDNYSIDEVKSNINDYYPGFYFEVDNKLCVIIHPR